jgi:glycosyltransferase involved in cell wall biosynthesis
VININTQKGGFNNRHSRPVPIAIVMISLNEAHNMEAVLDNISGWAQEVFLVDSFSSDKTIDIARSRCVKVFQTPFKGFGDESNFSIK